MELNAGDFERSFSALLAIQTDSGKKLSPELVTRCYKETSASLNLKAMPSDNLRINDLYEMLIEAKRGSLTSEAIFNAIYSK